MIPGLWLDASSLPRRHCGYGACPGGVGGNENGERFDGMSRGLALARAVELTLEVRPDAS